MIAEYAAAQGSSTQQWVYAIGLMAIGGILLGGAWSSREHGRNTAMIVLGILGVLAFAAGILWQFTG